MNLHEISVSLAKRYKKKADAQSDRIDRKGPAHMDGAANDKMDRKLKNRMKGSIRAFRKIHNFEEQSQIEKGVKDEMEHTKSKTVAKKIAKDHLKKHSDYYSKLEKAGLDESIIGAMAVGAAVGTLPYVKYGKKRKSVADRLMDTHSEKSYQKSKIKQSDGYLKKSKNPKTIDKYTKQKTDAEDKLKKTSYIKSLFKEGKWNYPKDMTKTKETSDMGTTNAAQNRKDRKVWRKKQIKQYSDNHIQKDWKNIKEATLGGAKLVGKSNPNNVKSKKSGFTINSKMNDAYSKVPDAKGLVRKRLLQKGKAAWNVGHAKKLAEEENLQELSNKTLKSYLKKAKAKVNPNSKKSLWGVKHFDRSVSDKIDKHDKGIERASNRLSGTAMVRKKYVMKEGLKKGDYGHEKEKKDLAWRKKVQAEYDGPNRDGKSANDGVRYSGD